MGHDLLTIYWLKAVEYILALSYLPAFLLFWRFVNPKQPATAVAWAAGPGWADQLAGFFRLPADLFYHPGHAWARMDRADVVTVGMNDFAQRLVGPIDRLHLPKVGTELTQGAPAFSIASGGKSVEMLAPVNGTVIAVNEAALASPDAVKRFPYGDGWLLRVRNPKLAANLKGLMSGDLARRWMDTVWEKLGADAAGAELGPVYLDGGVPVDGLARSMSPDNWDIVASRYLLTEEGGSNE
ncbi:MAG: glycine cleavage system protein H [Acidobacteria bacterium]|nr:MAG: glycine cleavage system protein H [Acidobacteriota bacterium]